MKFRHYYRASFQGEDHVHAMYGIFAFAGILGAVAASFLPESHKQDFPEQLEDLRRIDRNPYFSWFVWNKVTEKEHHAPNGDAACQEPLKSPDC